MKFCSDPRDTYLNELGYSVLRLPRKDVLPLTVIGRDRGNNQRLGMLPDIWHSGAATPECKREKAANVSGRRTSDFDLKIGVDILANALRMFGAVSPDISAELSNARTLQFEFTDVEAVGIDPIVIGHYLKGGEFEEDNPCARYFQGDKGVDALVISEALQARSIAMTAKSDAGAAVDLKIPAIASLVGASVTVSAHTSDVSGIAFQGPEYLTFGFQAWRIARMDGKWTLVGVRQSAATAFSHLGQSEPEKPVLVDRGFVDL